MQVTSNTHIAWMKRWTWMYKTEEWYFQKLSFLEVWEISDFQVYKNTYITFISLFFDLISFSGVLDHIYKQCTERTRCHVWAFLVITYCGCDVIHKPSSVVTMVMSIMTMLPQVWWDCLFNNIVSTRPYSIKKRYTLERMWKEAVRTHYEAWRN